MAVYVMYAYRWLYSLFCALSQYLPCSACLCVGCARVQLGCNKISDEGATHLAKALSLGCRTSKLSWLAVGGNSITDTGAVRLARALQGKTGKDAGTVLGDNSRWTVHANKEYFR